jgi:hypothetical protein
MLIKLFLVSLNAYKAFTVSLDTLFTYRSLNRIINQPATAYFINHKRFAIYINLFTIILYHIFKHRWSPNLSHFVSFLFSSVTFYLTRRYHSIIKQEIHELNLCIIQGIRTNMLARKSMIGA